MIATERFHNDEANDQLKITRPRPSLGTEICSKILHPVPPPISATRHEALSRRDRKTGALSTRKSSGGLVGKSESIREYSSAYHKHLGLEIRPEKLTWKGWELGEEYTRNFTIKNIHVKTQKIRYKAPSTRFFSTLFPQVIVLSAGTSFTLPVTFRPLEKEKYEDKIEFSTTRGSFTLVMQGLLPELSLHIPESIHFGLSTVHDTSEVNFEIRNMSNELAAEYTWDVSHPFTISPSSGTLQPRSSAWMNATFHPSTASVYEASVICAYGENLRKITKMEGIGKYPHLLVSTKQKTTGDNIDEVKILSFGAVNVHQVAHKHIFLHNLSNVKAPYKLRRMLGVPWMDKVFSLEYENGVVPPMSTEKVAIQYAPQLVHKTDIDYFQVSTIGNVGKSTFQCVGNCIGPKVTLNTKIVNFGVVHPTQGKPTSTRSFHINNESSNIAVFQLDLDENSGVFSVNCNSGILQPFESKTIIVVFHPPYFISYRRRAVLLVHEQEPMFLDLIGTSHGDEDQPPPLKPEHLTRYDVLTTRGLTFYSPDVLQKQLREGKLTRDESGCLMLPGDEKEAIYQQHPMPEYFDDGHNTNVTANPPHVSLDKMSIWMGEVRFTHDEPAVYNVTLQMNNHTRGKITAVWIPDPSGVFEVKPTTCDVPPRKSTDFRVIFRPNAPNQMYGKQLECFVYYKCMRDYRLVEDRLVFPPWLLTVDVAGHTFNGRNETFYPEVTISDQQLVFSPVTQDESSYRTIVIENQGSTPLLYQFLKEKECFTVKPHHGILRSKYHISVIRHIPSKVDTFEEDLCVRLNDADKHNQTIKLIGTGEKPELLLTNGGEMFFRPTCEHTSSTGDYEVRNVGRLPIRFKWVIPNEDSQYLSVKPEKGTILSNETQKHTWTFKPVTDVKYIFKPTCLARVAPEGSDVAGDSQRQATKFRLRVLGEGCKGEIKAEKYNIDFGCVITGSTKSEPLVMYNDSQCDLYFRLSLKQIINSQYGEESDELEPVGIKLSTWKAMVPARSKTTVIALAHPHRRILYTWYIYYELLSSSGKNIRADNRELLCQISAEGVYPTMAVIDARPSGSGTCISKTQLWRWFSVDHLNSCLDSDPEKAELVYSVATRHSASKRPNVYTKSIMDFNFGAAAVSSEPCYVSLMVKNTGPVPVEWAFLFPQDLELEMDYWAETGMFDAEELHELHIQDNKLFTVHPSRGVLNPSEHRTALLTYKHDVAGTHRLPVLLKIEHGKEILLNFIGVTVEPNRRYLHFPGTKHVFNPVPIGEITPPKQLYEMYNGGSVSVIYEIDMEPLSMLESSNYHHSILTCLNPRGEIPPGASANLEWIFSPLESKTYTVDIPIHIIGGETALITFKGIGYDTRVMGSSMPMLAQPQEFTSVPSSQKVLVPGQILFMSEERVSFENVPLFGKARHVVFLSNQSEDRPISYSWHATSETVNDVLQVEPVRGYLKPGQSQMTKITFCAAGQPSFYDLDLICEIVDEVKTAEYQAELEAWLDERARQAVEFVITDSNETNNDSNLEFYAGPSKYSLASSPMRHLENILNKAKSPVRLTDSDLSKQSSKSEYKSYQTLPPIRFEDPVKLPSNRSRLIRHQEAAVKNEWPQPQPPNPYISHLGVTARTHDIAQFRVNFAGENNRHFIDRTLQIHYPVPTKPATEVQYPLTTCNTSEKTMVISVMSDVIRGLLDDPTFHDAVYDIANDPVPYFGQIPKDEETTDGKDNLTEKQELQQTEETQQDEESQKEEIENEEQGEEQREEEEEEEERKQEEVAEEKDEKKEEKATVGDERAEIITEYQASLQDVRSECSPVQLMSELLRQTDGSRPSSVCEDVKDSGELEIIQRSDVEDSPVLTDRKNEQLKRSPQFGSLLEDVLASTISNIMEEALQGEVLLTVRPRVVALPPSRNPSLSHRISSSDGALRKSSSTGSHGSKKKLLKKSTSSHASISKA